MAIKAGQAETIELIAKTIYTHLNDPAVCDAGCGALWNITLEGNIFQ